MSLISRELERKVRALHRAELKKSAELRSEYKRARRSENSTFNRLFRRIFMPVFWNCIFLNIALKTANVGLTAAVISLWSTGTAFRWGHRWFQQFYASEELVILNFLPLNDRQIFRFQAGRYLSAARWTFWELLLAYGVLGIVQGSIDSSIYLLPVAAILQGLLVLALALHAASRLQMLPLNAIAGLLFATAFAVLVLGTQNGDGAGYIVQASNWFFPGGWLNYALLESKGDPVNLVLLVPIAGIIYLARFSWERLRSVYSLEGLEILPSLSRQVPSDDDEELSTDSFGHRAGPTEIEDRIAARSFLEGVNWESSGWLERFASRFLNARERVIAEFLVAHDPGWSRGFRWSFWVWLVSCTVVLFLGQFGGTLVFFTAYVLATASLPLLGGDWRGMRQASTGSVLLPGFALYPVSFNAISKILLKINFIRTTAALPFLLSFAALAAFKLEEDPLTGLAVAGKLIGMHVVLQPLFVLFPISSTTNDTSRMRLIWIFVFLPILVLLVAAAVGVFLGRTWTMVLGCYLMLLVLSTLLFLVYRGAYRKGRFDLLNQRPQQNS